MQLIERHRFFVGVNIQVADRDHDRWQIAAALDAAWLVVTDLVGRTRWELVP